MKRVTKALLKQVNWKGVEKYIISNKRRKVYRKVMVDLMQKKVGQLFKEGQAENHGKKEIVIDIYKRKKGYDEDVIDDQNRSK